MMSSAERETSSPSCGTIRDVRACHIDVKNE
jgi:hypothetical protein